MAEDWDDDDYVAPTLNTVSINASSVAVASNSNVGVVNSGNSDNSAQSGITLARQDDENRKRAKEEAKKVLERMEEEKLASETPEQRRLRERKRDEDADKSVTDDLFGVTPSNTDSQNGNLLTELCGIALNNKQDHTNFAVFVSTRLAPSTPLHLACFMDTITKRLSPTLNIESLDEVLATLNRVRASKIAQRQTNHATEKKSREVKIKKKSTEEKRIQAVFGESVDDTHNNDSYNQLEDDFM